MECPLHTENYSCPGPVSDNLAQGFLAILLQLMSVKCGQVGQCSYPENGAEFLPTAPEFDYVVVGAGSAGATLANRLSENGGNRVLVLEAGGLPTAMSEIPALLFNNELTDIDWQYQTQKSKTHCTSYKNGCLWPRGKCLGGSSTINGMLYIRGDPETYNHWAETGNPGWDYDSVLKYFKISENLQAEELAASTNYGRKGPEPLGIFNAKDMDGLKTAIKNAARELGVPSLQEEGGLGFFNTLQTIRNGVRENTGKVFLGGDFQKRRNLVVSLNSHVEQILFDEKDPSKATGVLVSIQLKNGVKKLEIFAKKEIIISAGAINTPQILMVSGIGPKKHLDTLGIKVRKNLAVGKNLQDHIVFPGFIFTLNPESMASNADQFYTGLPSYISGNFSGFLGNIGITNFVGFINTGNNSEIPDIQFIHILYPRDDLTALPTITRVMGLNDDLVDYQKKINKEAAMMSFWITLLHPKSRGEIRLKSSNPGDKPLIFANYLDNPEDVKTLIGGIRFAEKLLETESLKNFKGELLKIPIEECVKLEFGSNEYWECFLRHLGTTLYHPVGTCKMGPPSDPEAVVDSRLRVHGFKNLRVADASIMPEITGGNTNAPCIMIGQKAGAMILQDNSL